MVSSKTWAHSFLVTAVLGPIVGLQFISSYKNEKVATTESYGRKELLVYRLMDM